MDYTLEACGNKLGLESLGLAFKAQPLPHHFGYSKYMHGWANTGSQRKKMNPNASSLCPCCAKETETSIHLLQCSDPRIQAVRYQSTVRLWSSIVTTCGGSKTWSILHSTSLSQWLTTGTVLPPAQSEMPPGSTPKQFVVLIQTAMADQTSIGWDKAFQGYLGSSWLHAQQHEYPN